MIKNNITVKPDKMRLINLLEEINEGLIQIPVFQRDFVWKPNQMIELFDSIIKGYPIGSLLLWKPESMFATKEKVGPYVIKSQTSAISYVLDGFQRITTLFSVLTNPKLFNRDERDSEVRRYIIYYDLKEKEFTYLKSNKGKSYNLIPLYKVVDTFELLDFLRNLENHVHDKAERNILIDNAKALSKILYDYEVPYVSIKGGDIKSAVEIFSRVNSTGMDISEDFMLSALSYNQQTNFLFSDALTEFLISLGKYNFQNLKRDTVLNCIATSKGKIYFDIKFEDLLKPDLETLSKKAFAHVEKAVDFLYKELRVIDSRLLPYPTQLIFFSEFFRLNINPSKFDLDRLKEWFWTTSYSNYFTMYSLSQQRTAYKVFCDFARGTHPDGIYKVDEDVHFTTSDLPDKLNYISVRSKVLQLFLINQLEKQGPIESNESIKEIFLFKEKDRSPSNVLLRLSSEFETNKSKKEVNSFILNSSEKELEQYYINNNMKQNYLNNDMNRFISERQNLIRSSEEKFVSNLGIYYDTFFF